MKTRQTWHPIKPGDAVGEVYGGFYKQKDGTLYFMPNRPVDEKEFLLVRGMPSNEQLTEMLTTGTPFILDHKTSRRFSKVIRRLNNNRWRAERDKARRKEKTRRNAIPLRNQLKEVFGCEG